MPSSQTSSKQKPAQDGFLHPQALEIERAVLGALLSERRAIVAVIDLLQPALFYDKKHRSIYAAMTDLAREEVPVDILTVSERLKRQQKLSEVGGSAYLAKLSTRVSSFTHIEAHVRSLIEYSIRRNLIDLSTEMRQAASEGSVDALELLDTLEQQLFAIGQDHIKGEYTGLEQVLNEMMTNLHAAQENQKSGLTGIPSGFQALDRLTGGWQPGDLIVIAARPSMGKTAFAMNVLRNAAIDFDTPVAFFSLEMSTRQLAERLISAEAGIESGSFRKVNLTTQELEQLAGEGVQKLLHAAIYIDDTAAMSIMELRAKARRLCAKHKIKLVIVDYMQLMRGEQQRQHQGNREQEIASISRMLKGMAKELKVPVIAISQLSRETEKRQDKRPMLSDLRESGAIEQDADMVAFLYRPEYYGVTTDTEGQSTAGRTEVIVAKHRNGPTGSLWLQFVAEFTRFEDASASEEATYTTVESRMNHSEDNNPPF